MKLTILVAMILLSACGQEPKKGTQPVCGDQQSVVVDGQEYCCGKMGDPEMMGCASSFSVVLMPNGTSCAYKCN
jgi:hypothetical protein